eukprot:5047703-Amphidinium_carterae.1
MFFERVVEYFEILAYLCLNYQVAFGAYLPHLALLTSDARRLALQSIGRRCRQSCPLHSHQYSHSRPSLQVMSLGRAGLGRLG